MLFLYRIILISLLSISLQWNYFWMGYHKRMLAEIDNSLHLGWDPEEIDHHTQRLKAALWTIYVKELKLTLLRGKRI